MNFILVFFWKIVSIIVKKPSSQIKTTIIHRSSKSQLMHKSPIKSKTGKYLKSFQHRASTHSVNLLETVPQREPAETKTQHESAHVWFSKIKVIRREREKRHNSTVAGRSNPV